MDQTVRQLEKVGKVTPNIGKRYEAEFNFNAGVAQPLGGQQRELDQPGFERMVMTNVRTEAALPQTPVPPC
jgi:hypothetical protein